LAAENAWQSGEGRRGGEGRGEEEWRDRGRYGEERDDVDFAPSCKNSCG